MTYYADYEALQVEREKAIELKLYPYYLTPKVEADPVCPIIFKACNEKGKIVESQNYLNKRISFLDFLDGRLRYINENETITVKFHNVQFDFRIIFYELMYNGFKQIYDSEHIVYESKEENFIVPIEREPTHKQFSIIGKGLSKYIGVNIYYRNRKILIRDTFSIIPSAQDKILKEWGYKPKVDVDWDMLSENPDLINQNIDLINERCEYDVISLCAVFEQFTKHLSDKYGGTGATSASISLSAIKHYLCQEQGIFSPSYEDKENVFREYFPELPKGTISLISQYCYSGGICTVNPKHQGKILKNLQMLDINSSYPYSMTLDLPYGNGKFITDFVETGYSEYIVYIDFEHTGIPFQRCNSEIQARRLIENYDVPEIIYKRSDFPRKFKGVLCMNSIDLDTLKSHAKINKLEFKIGVNYNTTRVLAKFINNLYYEKANAKSDSEKRAIKLLLNSGYGKYAQDLSGDVTCHITIDEKVTLRATDLENIYRPLASAVTAHSRKNWIDTVYLIGNDFVYGDTDSIYFINVNKCISIFNDYDTIDSKKLGKWAFEKKYGKIIKKGKFLSKKNYMLELENGETKLTCVGLSEKYHDNFNFDTFVINSEPILIRKMKNCYGGKAMHWTEFKIKERAVIY